MLGRLARYLRFVGCDTAYARGVTDDQLLECAKREGRVLLTRDRALSRRAPSAFLVTSPRIEEQWRAVRNAWPGVPVEVRFDRCSLCNGLLRAADPGSLADARDIPPAARTGELRVFVCGECGHLYWEGSHTARIRAQIATWEGRGSP